MANRIGFARWAGAWVWAVMCVVAAALWAGAPAQAADSKRLAPGVAGLAVGQKVLLLPVDIELFSVSGGGVAEPRADWTAAARQHLDKALKAKLAAMKIAVDDLDEAGADAFAEQIALHNAVARAILLHHVSAGIWALPSKQGRLDWTVEDALQPLQAKTGARYALFVRLRDSYASAERKAALFGLALLGVVGIGGVQVGYASLVDLQTGQIVWFNNLGRTAGDVREAQPAAETVDTLLAEFPAAR